ncbi:MAG: 3-dehydroquinate synthase [Rhodospirillaceae bacterium]
MSKMTTLDVDLADRSYPIHIGSGLIDQAGTLLLPILRKQRVFIITDSNVGPLYLKRLQDSLHTANIASDALTVPAGEATKNFDHLQSVVEAMLAAKVERSTTVVALGGGVVGDLAGFAASITLRGIDFVQIPTTLLAQVDSSVGGKTGINAAQGKNLAGSFHQPKAVLIDIDALKTLPDRERRAGYAEVCKYGLLGDVDFWAWLEKNGAHVLSGHGEVVTKAIETSCKAKAAIVAADEREGGVRALLNLGHTFAHAFEAELGYSGDILHGEAVALGMVLAFDLSAKLGLSPETDLERVKQHFNELDLPTKAPRKAHGLSAELLYSHMTQDKKVHDGRITFVLVRGIGQAFLTQDATKEDVLAVLNATLTS